MFTGLFTYFLQDCGCNFGNDKANILLLSVLWSFKYGAFRSLFNLAKKQLCETIKADIHSSVGSKHDLRTGGRWFDLQLGQYSSRGLMAVSETGLIPLSFDNAYVGKEYCTGYWLEELQESIYRCTGHRDDT